MRSVLKGTTLTIQLFLNSAYKPGSVENGHLSLLCVTAKLQSITLCATYRRTSGKLSVYGVASDKVYSKSTLP